MLIFLHKYEKFIGRTNGLGAKHVLLFPRCLSMIGRLFLELTLQLVQDWAPH